MSLAREGMCRSSHLLSEISDAFLGSRAMSKHGQAGILPSPDSMRHTHILLLSLLSLVKEIQGYNWTSRYRLCVAEAEDCNDWLGKDQASASLPSSSPHVNLPWNILNDSHPTLGL